MSHRPKFVALAVIGVLVFVGVFAAAMPMAPDDRPVRVQRLDEAGAPNGDPFFATIVDADFRAGTFSYRRAGVTESLEFARVKLTARVVKALGDLLDAPGSSVADRYAFAIALHHAGAYTAARRHYRAVQAADESLKPEIDARLHELREFEAWDAYRKILDDDERVPKRIKQLTKFVAKREFADTVAVREAALALAELVAADSETVVDSDRGGERPEALKKLARDVREVELALRAAFEVASRKTSARDVAVPLDRGLIEARALVQRSRQLPRAIRLPSHRSAYARLHDEAHTLRRAFLAALVHYWLSAGNTTRVHPYVDEARANYPEDREIITLGLWYDELRQFNDTVRQNTASTTPTRDESKQDDD